MSFANKVALVTAGSKGIGKAIVQQLAAGGAKVAINYASDSAAADELVNTLGKDNAVAIKADAGKVPEIESMVKQTVDKFGKIDILVPNAGIMPMRTVENTTEEEFDSVYGLNVKGPYFLVQKALPHMGQGSKIIFISTSLCAASTVMPPYTLYLGSKGAIEQLTRVMAKDLGKKGINVNCIAPGPTGTELFYKGKPEQLINTIKGFSPFNKLGEPDEIASAVAYLSGDGARWVSGQTIRVNGAMA